MATNQAYVVAPDISREYPKEFSNPYTTTTTEMSTYPVTQVVTSQPQYVNTTVTNMIVVPGRSTRDWSSGICACCDDCSSCCCVLFCGHCYLCCMYSEYGEYCGTPMCVPLSDTNLRIQHRNRFGIKGSIIGDCCVTFWCFKNAQCQLKRDMKYVKNDLKQELF